MKYNLREMSDMEKPREKLYKFGASSLSDYELLAILLRTGTKDKSVIDVSIDLLSQLTNINDLQNLTFEEIKNIKGIGKVKAIELLATIELGKRITSYKNKKNIIKCAMDGYYYIKNKISHLEQEHFIAIYLSPINEVIADKIISIGTNTKTIADTKDVIRWAVKYSAYAMIITHNHPSGNPSPSYYDTEFTRKLKDACELVDVKLIDHIIVGKNKYFSFKEKSIFNE